MCHGSETCEISADPEALNAPKCNKLHVALKVAYACMTKVREGRELIEIDYLPMCHN